MNHFERLMSSLTKFFQKSRFHWVSGVLIFMTTLVIGIFFFLFRGTLFSLAKAVFMENYQYDQQYNIFSRAYWIGVTCLGITFVFILLSIFKHYKQKKLKSLQILLITVFVVFAGLYLYRLQPLAYYGNLHQTLVGCRQNMTTACSTLMNEHTLKSVQTQLSQAAAAGFVQIYGFFATIVVTGLLSTLLLYVAGLNRFLVLSKKGVKHDREF